LNVLGRPVEAEGGSTERTRFRDDESVPVPLLSESAKQDSREGGWRKRWEPIWDETHGAYSDSKNGITEGGTLPDVCLLLAEIPRASEC
jgi:hypothetical protein